MDTRLLKMFLAVAREGSLVRAAARVHLTPSALSHGLKLLETEVGCRLFDRVGRGLVLNQAGEHLLTQVEGPLALLERAADSIRALGKWGQGRLRLGAPVTACQHLLPGVLRELRREFPSLQLVVESGDMPHLIELLQARRIDLALGIRPDPAPELELRPVFEDELLFVLPSGHAWADGRSLSREDLRRQPIILYQRHSSTARIIQRHFEAQEVDPASTMEIASVTAIKEMVRLNVGVGILPPWVVGHDLARGSLKMRPLGPSPLRRRWVVAHLPDRTLSLPEVKFGRLCRTHALALRLDRKDLPEAGRVRVR